MPRAAIVATARTPIGKAHRGAFNNTSAPELAGHAIAAALAKTGIDPSLVEDVVMGAAVQQGTQSFNVARQGALRAGLPVTVPGQTIDRQCSSGLMAVATAAKQILFDSMDVAIGGGVESISLVQNEHYNKYRSRDSWLEANVPGTYMPMLRTAELVAERYGISREAQDQMAAASQQRAANAQASGRFDDEIAPIWVTTLKTDKESGEVTEIEQLVSRDEGVRAGTTVRNPFGPPHGPAARGIHREPDRDGRQRLAAVRRRLGQRADEQRLRRVPGPGAAGLLLRHRRDRVRTRRDGHRPGHRHPAAPEEPRADRR